MKTQLTAVKNHVRRNRAKYAAATTFTMCAAFQIHIAKEWNTFLDEHDLTDAYYKSDE